MYHLERSKEYKPFRFKHMKIDYYSALHRLFPFGQLRPAYKMPICHADALFDSEFYRRKIIKNLRKLSRKLVEMRQALQIIFLTKVHRHKSGIRNGEVRSFSQVTWCSQSPLVVSLSLFLFCVSYQSLFFSFSLFLHYFWKSLFCLLNYIREADSRISVCSPRLHTEKEVDRIIQNSSERLYCSFLWETARNHPSVT